MTLPKCKTCVYWERINDHPRDYGRCRRIRECHANAWCSHHPEFDELLDKQEKEKEEGAK